MSRFILPRNRNVFVSCFLGGNDHRKVDEMFHLCIDQDMRLFCLIHHIPDGDSPAWWSDPIMPADFSKHSVEGRDLGELVREKLQDLFPVEDS